MTLTRFFKLFAALVALVILSGVLFIAIFGWNWLRGPIERAVTERTGRALVINGQLTVKLGWPWPRVHAEAVTFANPAWASEKYMLSTDSAEFALDLPSLFQRKLKFPEVRLKHAAVFLEHGKSGQKSWLLDRLQQDESARIQIDRLALERATLGYDEPAKKTHIRSELSSVSATTNATPDAGIVFSASGTYLGAPMQASGSGGPILALRDESTPYPLTIKGNIGPTLIQASGKVTSLVKITALDVHLALSGKSLDQLYPLLGIALPATGAYAFKGQLLRDGSVWNFKDFSGVIGHSDVAGFMQVNTGGARPALKAALTSRLLDLADLGPLIGAQPGKVKAAQKVIGTSAPSPAPTPRAARVLPEIPFRTDRWNSVDAELDLRAKTLRRDKALPLLNFSTHLSLRDAVLTLDPLEFGLAGGQLLATISLDGRQNPIQAHAKVQARNLQINQLLPTVNLSKASIGTLNGKVDLRGKGNSVGVMLASADGKLGLVISGGTISKLLMEKISLHLWEILTLTLSGDQTIRLRCAVADFDVKSGVMRADALILDTEISTIHGMGNIDLRQEKLDLTFNPATKNTSPLALRSPIYLRGNFAKPEIGVDKVRVATRALGAVVLGLVNPLLALVPLVDAGPGKDSDCGQLVRDAKNLSVSKR